MFAQKIFVEPVLPRASQICYKTVSDLYIHLLCVAGDGNQGLSHAKQALHNWATCISLIYSFKSSKSIEYCPTYDSSIINILIRCYTYRDSMLISAHACQFSICKQNYNQYLFYLSSHIQALNKQLSLPTFYTLRNWSVRRGLPMAILIIRR